MKNKYIMKMNKSHYITLALLLVFVLVFTEASAQGNFGDLSDINFDDSVNDEPAPINGLIAIALAVGGYLGIRQTKNKK